VTGRASLATLYIVARGYDVDVAVITETHFKSKHTDSVVSVSGYTVLRRDRNRRRGGGVALYVRSSLPLSAWTFSGDDRTFELLWSCVNGTFIGSLYHPPRPAYTVESLLNYIEQCMVELNRDYRSSNIVLAGDFNLLPESAVVERTGFDQLVQQPTRGATTLHLVFVSRPMYDVTRVADSVVKSDHKAVIVCNDQRVATCNKRKDIKTYRKKSPNQHASFLEHIATIEFYLPLTDIQAAFDQFYSTALFLYNHFYPERSLTVSSRDPDYITPDP